MGFYGSMSSSFAMDMGSHRCPQLLNTKICEQSSGCSPVCSSLYHSVSSSLVGYKETQPPHLEQLR